MFSVSNALKLALVVANYVHIIYCPFSKVEESFNTQAIHDILFHGTNLTQYDHNTFSGVVPRTFIGALMVSIISMPFVKIMMGITENLFLAQLIARCVLGCLNLFALFHFTSAVRKQFNPSVEKWTLLITLTQFHFMFYISRTLPNTFALMFFLHLAAYWLKQKYVQFIWLSAFVILVFRFELCIICGIMLLLSLLSQKLSIATVIVHGFLALVVSVALTVLIDSYFWGYWLWPEASVLWFNTVLNKSSEWGTSPFLWYFYSVLPRVISLSLFLVPFGLFHQTRKVFTFFILPSIGFVFIYSFLPHKELRFIIYVFPFLNVIAAKGIDDFRKQRFCGKAYLKPFILFVMYSHFAINILITLGFMYVSKMNYPGAHGLLKLHEIESQNSHVNVHIDVYSAQTGISRFLELNRDHGWIYDKSEFPTNSVANFAKSEHTHLLVEAESETDLKEYLSHRFKILAFIRAYSGIYLDYLNLLPMPKIIRTPKIYILKRIN